MKTIEERLNEEIGEFSERYIVKKEQNAYVVYDNSLEEVIHRGFSPSIESFIKGLRFGRDTLG